MAVKTTNETGCSLVALFFIDFLSLRTDSFWDRIARQHISVLKSIFVKAAVVGTVVCFTLATCIGAMDVLLSASQCPLCMYDSLGTQGKLHLASGICLGLFLLSYFGG